MVGVAIALLVLLPETLAAARAASRDRLQTSLNLAYGSALASIGLTIPAIAVASIWFVDPLLLGLSGTELVLLALTGLVGTLTVVQGTRDRAAGRDPPADLRVVPVHRRLALTGTRRWLTNRRTSAPTGGPSARGPC